jgi:AcrR family transcriptional regulator
VPGGARRNEDTRRAVLAAALELTSETGYERAAIEEIARRAGTSKQTIYRWWPSKAAILQEAFVDIVGGDLEHGDTGDLLADLRAQMVALVRFFAAPAFSRSLRGLIGAAQSDPDVAETLFRSLFEPRRRRAATRLVAGQQRGELTTAVEPETMIDALYGPLYYRLLVTRHPLTPEFVDALLTITLVPHLRRRRPSSG